MSSTFPRTRSSSKGYDVDEVEEFLEDARRAYLAEPGADAALDAEGIRRVAFTMRKGGYSPVHVDAALERLEDAFASRERDALGARIGDRGRLAEVRDLAQVVLDRAVRPAGHRFRRTTVLAVGYDIPQVDAFADRIADHLQHGAPLSIDEVRTVAFTPRRGGYNETQVDMVLDAMVEVLLGVR